VIHLKFNLKTEKSLTMLVTSILIIHFINQTTTTTLYEKHNIHEPYTYEYTCQTYISKKYVINMAYIHLKSNIKQSIICIQSIPLLARPTTKARCISVSATRGRASIKTNCVINKCRHKCTIKCLSIKIINMCSNT
jgi:hypothetical protein